MNNFEALIFLFVFSTETTKVFLNVQDDDQQQQQSFIDSFHQTLNLSTVNLNSTLEFRGFVSFCLFFLFTENNFQPFCTKSL